MGRLLSLFIRALCWRHVRSEGGMGTLEQAANVAPRTINIILGEINWAVLGYPFDYNYFEMA